MSHPLCTWNNQCRVLSGEKQWSRHLNHLSLATGTKNNQKKAEFRWPRSEWSRNQGSPNALWPGSAFTVGFTHTPIACYDPVISVTKSPSLLSAEHFPKEQMISPTFPSSPPHFLLCPAHQTKARSQRAISEDSSPEIPNHSGEMVLMGKKRYSRVKKQEFGNHLRRGPGLSSKGPYLGLQHNLGGLYLRCPFCKTGSLMKGQQV